MATSLTQKGIETMNNAIEISFTARTPQASLLGIAVEVRCMIYKLLIPLEIEYFNNGAENSQFQFRKRVGEHREDVRALPRLEVITQVCKQVRQETLPILLARTKIAHLEYYGCWRRCIDPRHPHLTHLSIQRFHHVRVLYFDKPRLEGPIGCNFPQLQSLIVGDVPGCWLDAFSLGFDMEYTRSWRRAEFHQIPSLLEWLDFAKERNVRLLLSKHSRGQVSIHERQHFFQSTADGLLCHSLGLMFSRRNG